MTQINTGENLEELVAALRVVASSEWVGIEAERGNHHHLQDELKIIADEVHVCEFNGTRHDYFEGEYEVECSHEGCWNTEYHEADE